MTQVNVTDSHNNFDDILLQMHMAYVACLENDSFRTIIDHVDLVMLNFIIINFVLFTK